MGQYWYLVCWDKQLKSKNLGKLGEFFYGCSYDELGFVIDALSLKRERKDPLGRSAPVENLPVSILEGIIFRLRYYDKDEFLLTSRLIAGEIYQKCSSSLSWQGCRIACVGDYTGKVPCRLARAGVNVKTDESFYYYIDGQFQEISRDMIDEIREAKMVERMMTGEEEKSAKMVEQEMTGEEEKSAKFVVLNESRKEYVVTNRRDFTKVISSLICWSDDPSASMRTNHDITKGRWAWNRISILSLDEFEPVAAECKDITERVYRHVKKIVKQDTGRGFPSE